MEATILANTQALDDLVRDLTSGRRRVDGYHWLGEWPGEVWIRVEGGGHCDYVLATVLKAHPGYQPGLLRPSLVRSCDLR